MRDSGVRLIGLLLKVVIIDLVWTSLGVRLLWDQADCARGGAQVQVFDTPWSHQDVSGFET